MLLVISPLSVSALGQVTQPIVYNQALRGQSFQETLYVINTEKKDILVVLAGEGQIASWVKFYPTNDSKNATTTFNLKAGANLTINAVFTVPSGTANGEYKGVVSARQKAGPNKTDKTSATIEQKIDRPVTIKVTDKEIIQFEASVIPYSYDLKNGEPLKIRVIYDNRGNINISPEMKVSIKNLDNQILYSVILPYPTDLPAVTPSSLLEVPSFEVPTNNLQNGKYRAEIEFIQSGKSYLNKSFKFSVGNVSAVLGLKLFNSNNYWIFAIGIVVLLLIALAIYQTVILIKKRRKEKII